LQSPTPINEVARFIYTLYTPVPPVKDFDLKSFYIGVGAILWYFTIPFLYFGIKAGLSQKKIRKESITISIYLLITLFGIMLTSIDVRHKTMIFAVSFLYAAAAFSFMKKRMVIKVGAIYGFLIGVLAAAYLVLKTY
jgi:predicted branched-subunit amino acid permease